MKKFGTLTHAEKLNYSVDLIDTRAVPKRYPLPFGTRPHDLRFDRPHGKLQKGVRVRVVYPDTTKRVPDPNVYGSDSFSFTVNDGESTSREAIVSIDLDAVNDPPVARSVVFNVVAGSCYSGYFSATDVDGGQSSYFIDQRPYKGSISLNSVTGAFTYCADAGTSGTDTFSYKAYDGMDFSSPATVQAQITYSEAARAVSTTNAPRRSH